MHLHRAIEIARRSPVRLTALGAALCLALGSAAGAQAADADADRIDDAVDSCPVAPNPLQSDSGGVNAGGPDGIGDACQCGDADQDGDVDSDDVSLVIDCASGQASCPALGDTNNDGVVASTDAFKLITVVGSAETPGSGDACALTCLAATGGAGQPDQRPACTGAAAACGNAVLEFGEGCDDGNTLSGDGCTAACVLEVCGDGTVNNGGVEECDDGNTLSGDGCSSGCQLEPSGDRDGDGIPNGLDACADAFDPAQLDASGVLPFQGGGGADGIGDACQCGDADQDGDVDSDDVSLVIDCASGQASCPPLGDTNNDGIVASTDAFKLITVVGSAETPGSGDACALTCFAATGGPGLSDGRLACLSGAPECGNGVLEAGEECDDGDSVGGDGCSAACVVEFCGDGIINNGGVEECDDGNTLSGDGCNSSCRQEAPGGGGPLCSVDVDPDVAYVTSFDFVLGAAVQTGSRVGPSTCLVTDTIAAVILPLWAQPLTSQLPNASFDWLFFDTGGPLPCSFLPCAFTAGESLYLIQNLLDPLNDFALGSGLVVLVVF